jgi:hypothetical protein
MPRLIPIRLAAACALALALSLSISASAGAKGLVANLRVVGTANKVLAEQAVADKTTSVKTSPGATCFGAGTGGSGASVSIKGNTAMGLLASGAKTIGALKPLSISDSFDFGLALCGVGKSVAKGKASWYVKVNHKALSVGGDVAKIKAGDEVLYDLAPSYPYPDELALTAPAEATAGVPFTVRAWSYDEKGKRKPAAGVKIQGAIEPTAADGKVQVTLTEPTLLSGANGDDIPSAAVPVCLGGECPTGK